jgi:hypothetical protein
MIDHAGSAMLEDILGGNDRMLPGFDNVRCKEAVGPTCWYLWRIRCHRTHGESVPPIFKCKMPILSITTNAAKVGAKPTPTLSRWEKPSVQQLKVNVDWSFHWNVQQIRLR